jgi:signal transduction histidine kinase
MPPNADGPSTMSSRRSHATRRGADYILVADPGSSQIVTTSTVRHSHTSGSTAVRPRRSGSGRSRTGSPPASESFFRDLVWSLQNGVIAITREGRVAVMNEVAYRVLGITPRSSDIGTHFSEILGDNQEVARILAGAFDVVHLPNRAELRLKSAGKVIGYTLSHVRPETGAITGATFFFKDLTRVEQLEERERLRDRLAALGEMAASIAHEVKNPLAGIEVMAGVLKRQMPDSPDAQSILQDIINEAKMANAIVLEILEFVRPIRLQLDRIHLAGVLRDAIGLAGRQVVRGDVDVALGLTDALPAIDGDPHQLRQLFTNLLTNAFEALAGHGRVGIRADLETAPSEAGEAGPAVTVEVSDDGPGVPAEIADRIFRPFFTTKPKGSGLGLAIVRKIVDAHDGRIDMFTPAGGGTCFRVTLPVDVGGEMGPSLRQAHADR